ncbi:MAG: pectinesterase family protein [Mucilaginibacter sp.]|uniref:pectinesterase family protein n=1 Tax=Mucilaginibacter sp. TaxID=1882438 RepID=UPI003262DB70
MKTKIIIFSLLTLCTLYGCKKSEVNTQSEDNAKFVINGDPVANLVVAYNIIVAKDGSGNYTTVQAALNAVPDNSASRTVIYIKNGVYQEVVTLASTKKNVTLIGESMSGVKLTYNNYSSKINPATGLGYGTAGSSSVFIKAEGFYAVNVTFENSSGPVGQALAISVTADKAVFNNCSFLGRQDTYYGDRCRQYLKGCYLEGTTDFIFGGSTAVFESCKLYSYGGSAITAASTESYVTYGLVFLKCNITGASGAHTDLGRPWGAYAAVAYLNTAMSSVVNAAGWNDWGNTANQATARFSEYRNNGSGSTITSRPAWITRLTDAQALNYTVTNILKTTYSNPVTTDNWNPNTVISATGAPIN